MGILDRVTNKVINKTVDKTVNKVADKTINKAIDKASSKSLEKKVENKKEEPVLKEENLEKMLCPNCNLEITKDDVFCNNCGTKLKDLDKEEYVQEDTIEKVAIDDVSKVNEETRTDKKDFISKVKELNNTKDTTDEYSKEDIETYKILSMFSYLWWLLLIPLFTAKESKFARFHLNQGIILAIIETVWIIIHALINRLIHVPFLNVILSIIVYAVEILFLVVTIIGIMNALNGKAKELPVIGKFKILK